MVDFGEPVISSRAHRSVEMSERGTCYRHELDTEGNAGIFAMRAGPKTGEPYLPEFSVGGNPALPNGIAAELGRPKYSGVGIDPEHVAEFVKRGAPKDPADDGDCVATRLKHPATVMSRRVPFM